MEGPDISRYDGHGFTKPFPSFKWCESSLASSGTAASLEGFDTTADKSDETEALGFMVVV